MCERSELAVPVGLLESKFASHLRGVWGQANLHPLSLDGVLLISVG